MTKNDFLCSLERLLSPMPEEDRMKQLSYYSEMIADMTEDGLTEDGAVERLGAPEDIAADILSQNPPAVKSMKDWTPLSITLTAVGSPLWLPIALVLACVLVVIYIAVWCVITALFAAVLGIAVGAVAALVVSCLLLFRNFGEMIFTLGAALVLAGIAVLAFLGSLYAARGLVRLTAAIARSIKKMFTRKER